MRLLSLSTLREFWERFPDAERFLREWRKVVEASAWKTAHEIKASIPSADPLGDRLVCFDINSNRYRIIALVDYPHQMVLIRFIGTHAEYDDLMDQKHWRKKLL
jgi:mRNA interferase HigB